MPNFDTIKRKDDPKDVYVGARISSDLKEWVESFCRREKIKSVSALLELLLTDLRKQHEGKNHD